MFDRKFCTSYVHAVVIMYYAYVVLTEFVVVIDLGSVIFSSDLSAKLI